jgi:hypothetical protein
VRWGEVRRGEVVREGATRQYGRRHGPKATVLPLSLPVSAARTSLTREMRLSPWCKGSSLRESERGSGERGAWRWDVREGSAKGQRRQLCRDRTWAVCRAGVMKDTSKGGLGVKGSDSARRGLDKKGSAHLQSQERHADLPATHGVCERVIRQRVSIGNRQRPI